MLEVSDLIKVELWNRARWMGTALGGFHGEPPFMALAFQNGEPGREVMRGLHAVTGDVDEQELLRVSIIEGHISGLDPGYTIQVGPRLEALVSAAAREGHSPESIAAFSRFQRMHPKPGSTTLPDFKRLFAEHQRYWLMGATIGGPGGFTLHPETRIGKRILHFRQAEDIGPNDPDCVVLMRLEQRASGPVH